MVDIEIEEITDRVPLTDAELAQWERTNNRHRYEWEREAKPLKTKGVANGRLRVCLPSRWSGARGNWSEGRTSLWPEAGQAGRRVKTLRRLP